MHLVGWGGVLSQFPVVTPSAGTVLKCVRDPEIIQTLKIASTYVTSALG